MPKYLEFFTNSSRFILQDSQNLAEEAGTNIITPVHLIVAMTRLKQSDAFNTLQDYDIIESKLLPFVKTKKRPESNKEELVSSQAIDLSNEVKKTLELSVDTARRKGMLYIGTGHLLIGLMRLETDSIISILKHFNVIAPDIIKRAEYYLDDYSSAEHQSAEIQIQQRLNDMNESRRGCFATIMDLLGLSTNGNED